MVFRNDQHKVTFEKEIQLHEGCGKEVTAALYLLTADPRLWRQVERHVGTKSIDITAMKLRRLDGMAYVCFMAAKDMLTGGKAVDLSELADRSLMPPRSFMLITTALLIKGYGLNAADRLTFTST